ncbi:MAG: LuxR C-terminal-related transcriptional regulator [Propionicimonas sp.]
MHPQRHQLQRVFAPPSRLPQLTWRDGSHDWVHAMAFARAAGRIDLARSYARRGFSGIDGESVERQSHPLGQEWLVWFQLGLTSLASGELQRATEEFATASGYATRAPGDGPSAAVRLTFGYRALVAALLGATTAASNHLARAQGTPEKVGGFAWSLLATTRALVDVEENTPESHDAIAALELIDDPEPFWACILLAQTRYAELHGLAVDSLALIERAESRYRPEIGSFAYDILVARRVEALVILGRLAAARATYNDKATDSPHCRVAQLGLLCAEHNFGVLERETEAVLGLPSLAPAQRVQAQALGAMGLYGRDGAIPDYLSPGIGFALSQRRHRRIALMFPPFMRDALAPHLLAETFEEWERSKITIRLWSKLDAKALALTPRELALLRHIDHDLSSREIAAREHVSINTVKTQLKSLYRKLGVSTRAEAVARGRRSNLLEQAGDLS